jgi:tape measure domain-containing protein
LLAFSSEIVKSKATMVAAMEAVGVDTIAGLLNGLNSQDERVKAAAKSLGESLIKSIKTTLGIASPSKKFEEIGKNVGKGFEKGALSSMDDAFDALENKMRQRGKILDTVARGIFRMLGMDPAAMLQQAREQRTVPARTPIAGLLPSFTGRGTREETIRQLSQGGGGGGGPSVAQGPGMLALSNEALGRRVSAILQEYFKVAEVQIRESFNPQELKQSLNIFSYIAQSLRDAESRTKQARVAESVDSLMQTIDNAIKVAQARVRISTVQVSEVGARAQASLSASRVAGFLPGRPSQASVLELNNILAGAIREYFAAVARGIKPSAAQGGRPLLGPGSTIAGLLPPAGGTTPIGQMRFNAVSTGGRTYGPVQPRFTAPSLPPPSESRGYLGGRTGSSVRTRTPGGFTGGGIPSGGGPEATAFVNASRNALAYSQALGRLQESLRGVQAGQLPLVGSIKGLAGEFGQATKQVLLYGTAYKGLAFLTSLPSEAFNAAKALGTYKNQLQAVTSETGTFSNSLAFVDNLAQRFNVPLESARQGFIKLYASMQPAGFSQEQIEGLFTGISQATAVFGLSADKVDRVNYAFAQMASKGQIMSEELKGQLGDVLPGALALFAEAAKMSIPEFSKAMEDGRFKGEAMAQVLENVGILMKVKFGAGAAGASKTLQGALNGIQNSLKLMYEAFGPLVNRMAAIFGPKVTSLIKNVTNVIKAFELGISTTGDSFAAMSPQAQGFYSSIQSILPSIKSLVPSFVAAAQNIGYFAASLATASQPLMGLLKLALDFISIPFVARVGVYATVIGLLTSAFTLLKNTGIIQATIAMIRFMATLTVGQVQAWIGSIQAAIATLVAMIRTANLARLGLMALKVTLISFGVGAVLIGLDFVAQRLLNIGAAADDARKRTAELTDELARAVETGNVALASQKYVEGETKAQSLAKSKQVLERFQGGFQQGAPLTKQEYQQLQRSGLATGISFNERKGRATATSGQVAENLRTAQAGYVEALNASGSAQEALKDSMQVAGNMQRQLEASRSQMKDIPPATGVDGDGSGQGAGTKLDTYNRSQLDFISQQAQLEKAMLDGRLQQQLISATQYKISLAELELETAKLEQAERLRLATEQINKDNLSAQDKQLKLVSAQRSYQNELNIAQEKYTIAVEGARKELEGPFNQALEGANAELLKQQMIAGNLQLGIAELTPDQESYLQVLLLVTGKTEDELNILKDKIAALRETLELTKQIAKENRFNERLNQLRDEIDTLRIINSEERRLAELRADGLSNEESQKIFNLEKIKKNIEDVRALIDGFVSQTSSDYKGFLKAVISGEDAVDALKQFQQGLKDRVLTIFLDFAMAPVEKFMKEAMEGIFLPGGIKGLTPAEEQAKTGIEGNTVATDNNTTAINSLTAVLQGAGATSTTSTAFGGSTGEGIFDAANVFGGGGNLTGGIFDTIAQQMGGATESFDSFSAHMGQFVDSSIASSESLGTWTNQGLENLSSEATEASGKWQESLGKAVGAIGIAAGSIMGIAAGIGQIKEGGTSNILGGIGSIMTSIGGGIMGFMNLGTAANGAVWNGGFQAFANGGTVTGPTLGLIGEGKYNEAIVPLPDGRSIPVQMRGGSSRDLLNAPGSAPAAPTMLSMSFQSTTINGVEYVDRAQLEAAMAETRKSAARDGASRGASLALDKLQNSPSARRRIGIR